MTIPSIDLTMGLALAVLALAVLYSLGVFDRLMGRSPAPTPTPAPQPIAPPPPAFYGPEPTEAPDPYVTLLAYHAMIARDADALAARRVYHNAVTGRSIGREADLLTTFAATPPAAIPLPPPPPPPTVEPPTAATAAKARTTARKATK